MASENALNAFDLIIAVLREHEKKLDLIVEDLTYLTKTIYSVAERLEKSVQKHDGTQG